MLNDIEISPGGELFLADQTATAPGIWIWDTAADTLLTPSPRSTGLPPFQITFSVPAHAAADLTPALALGANYPNPFNPSTTIPFSLDADGHVELSVYDAAGRLIRILESGHFTAGMHETRWDGVSGRGRSAASGVYFLRMVSGGRASTRKIVLLR